MQLRPRSPACSLLMVPPPAIASISYDHLKEKERDLSPEIEAAFGCGPNALGIISISHVPGYPALRQKLLQLSPKLDSLPEEAKKKLQDPESKYMIGWCFGIEKLSSGKPDTFKGSFSANPLVDTPTTDASDAKRYPWYCNPNKWPREELPEFEAAFKELAKVMLEVGILVAFHCSKFVATRSEIRQFELDQVLLRSRAHKGSLMHYRSNKQSQYGEEAKQMASWCNWHCDHGCLTGLTSAMYLKDGSGGVVPCPDNITGLYIKTRDDEIVRVVIGEDEIAYQIGETTEILSKGLLCATPHCVRAPAGDEGFDVSRSTFALFMQPDWDQVLRFPQGAGEDMEMTFGAYSWKRWSANMAL